MDLFLRPSDLFADAYWGRLVDGMPPDAALLAYYTAMGLDAEASAALIAASHAPEGDLDAALTHAESRLSAGEIAKRVLEAVDISDLWAIGIIRRIAENDRYPARARLDAVRLGLEMRDRVKTAAPSRELRSAIDTETLVAVQALLRAQIAENGRVLHIVRPDDAPAAS